MFIRISDVDDIQKQNVIFNFFNAKRKGNKVKKFKIRNNELTYFEEELETKKIPKFTKDEIPTFPIFIVIAGDSEIVFQDINNTVHFLKLEDNEIIKSTFFELEEDDDVLIYDDELNDYNIVSIKNLLIVDDDLKVQELDSAILSDYILYSNNESGIIVNNFLLI
jgi:hypothetical protein